MSKKKEKFQGNIISWLNYSALDIDYFIQFIKSWIPFNAWYYNAFLYYNQDREIINELKKSSNPVKNKIKSHLINDDCDSIKFKDSLANLHLELEKTFVPNDQNRISFSNIIIEKNSTNSITGSYRNYTVKVDYNDIAPKGTQKVRVQVIRLKGYKNIVDWNQNDWDYNELNEYLRKHSIIKKLNGLARVILSYYCSVNPLRPSNLVLQAKVTKTGQKRKPNNSIELSKTQSVYFDDDIEKISKSIIEVLYNLRNILFHGEINPTKEIQKIYKHAYEILSILLNAIK